MTSKKPKKPPPPGLSERQAGAFMFDRPQGDETVKRVFERIFSDDDTALMRWKIISAALAATSVILAFLLFSPGNPSVSANVKNSVNTSVIGSAQNVTITQMQNIRPWNELTTEEQSAIKEEARKRFPKIDKIGSRVSWKDVSEWMAEEKRVVHSNPRDLFRDRN